jgi:hypothetical protein
MKTKAPDATVLPRASLLQALEAVRPALSTRDIIEQSSNFVFRGGRVWAYNGELCCRAPTGLPKELTGAVASGPLLKYLAKMPDEEIGVRAAGGKLELLGRGGRRWAKILFDAEVLLPLDSVEKPGGWRALPEDFSEALGVVYESAGTDANRFHLTCVHFHPEYLEATDDDQLTRYRLALGHTEPYLVRRETVRAVVPMGVTSVSETQQWVHFRNPARLVVSCQRHVAEAAGYPDLGPHLRYKGTKTEIPRKLADDAELAELFSSENEDRQNRLHVTVRDGRMTVRAVGVTGEAGARMKIRYGGPPLSFAVGPRTLAEIAKRMPSVEIGPERLIAQNGKWQYLVCLEAPEVGVNGEASHGVRRGTSDGDRGIPEGESD